MERDIRLHSISISLEHHIKIPVDNRAPRKKQPSPFPKSGALMEADANFQALLNIHFGGPIKGNLSKGPLHGMLHREMPHH